MSRRRDDRGAVLMLTAITLPVLLLMTAFAVDLGRQRVARRDMQAKADVIALDLSRLIDGSQLASQLEVPSAYSTALAASASRNNVPLSKIQSVDFGMVNRTTGKFDSCQFDCPATAVKVTTHDTVGYFFQRGTGSVTRSAVGMQEAIAGFSIGSFAAALDPLSSGYDPNAIPLLNQLLGNAASAGVLSYNGLATANVTYLQIANQLGFATPSELFASNTSAFQVINAAAQVMQANSGNAAQISTLNSVLAVSNSPLKNVTIGQVVGVQAGAADSALASQLNVLDFLATSAFLAHNGSALTIPSAVINFPGITGNLSVNLIQAPQTAYGPVGTQANTSQVSIGIPTFTVGTGSACNTLTSLLASLGALISGLTSLLGLLTGPTCGLLTGTVGLTIKGNIALSFAKATGTIDRIACPSTGKRLGVATQSGLVSTVLSLTVQVGSNPANSFPLQLSTSGNGANGRADFVLTPGPDVLDKFKASNPGSGSLGLNTTSLSSNSTLNPLLTGLTAILNPLLTAVDNNLVLPLSNLLGLRVAGSDVAARAISCNAVKLAG